MGRWTAVGGICSPSVWQNRLPASQHHQRHRHSNNSHPPSHARRLDSSIGSAKRKALPGTRFAPGARRRVSPPSVLSAFHGSDSSTTLALSTCRSFLQSGTCGGGASADAAEVRGPIVAISSGPAEGPHCITHASGQSPNRRGPTEAAGLVSEVVGKHMRMQKGQECHMSRLQPRRQKSEGMQPSTFLFGGACRRPSLKHAGARHNAFAASFAVNRCCRCCRQTSRCRHHGQHAV
jgi:hypothetical protein